MVWHLFSLPKKKWNQRRCKGIRKDRYDSLPTSTDQVSEVFSAFIFTELWAIAIYGSFKYGFVMFLIGLVWFNHQLLCLKKNTEFSETSLWKGFFRGLPKKQHRFMSLGTTWHLRRSQGDEFLKFVVSCFFLHITYGYWKKSRTSILGVARFLPSTVLCISWKSNHHFLYRLVYEPPFSSKGVSSSKSNHYVLDGGSCPGCIFIYIYPPWN